MSIEGFLVGVAVGLGLSVIIRGMMSADHERYIAARQAAAQRDSASMLHDAEIARRAQSKINAISEAWHIHSECQATELFLHPADDVILPYIVMTNRVMDGLLRFCGMTVVYDDALPVGGWRIEVGCKEKGAPQ